MGLKNLKSRLDLLGGFGQEGETLGGMEKFNPTGFQRTTDIASQVHIDSLQVVPGGTENSAFQDINGEPGPQFQKPTDVASQSHIDSLQQVPGGSQNSPHQDLNGEPGPHFQKATDLASQAHISSLALVPGGTENSAFQDFNNGARPAEYISNMPQ